MRSKAERELIALVESYAAYCKEEQRMPNRAGFLRYSKMSLKKFSEISAKSAETEEMISAIFEDEALNSGGKRIPAATLNMYLKSRFGYGEREEEEYSVQSDHDEGDFE